MKRMLVALGLGLGAVMLSGNALAAGNEIRLQCKFMEDGKEKTRYYKFVEEDTGNRFFIFDEGARKWDRKDTAKYAEVKINEGLMVATWQRGRLKEGGSKINVVIDRRTAKAWWQWITQTDDEKYHGQCAALDGDPVLAKPKF